MRRSTAIRVLAPVKTVRVSAQEGASVERVIVWLKGTHRAGKSTTSALLRQLIPVARVFEAEMVGETAPKRRNAYWDGVQMLSLIPSEC